MWWCKGLEAWESWEAWGFNLRCLCSIQVKLVFRQLKLRLQWSNKQSKGSPSTEMYRSASSHGLEENRKCTVKVGQHAGEQSKWHETREGSAGRGELGKRRKTCGGEESAAKHPGAAQHSEVGAGVKKEESLLIFVKSQETCLKEVMKTWGRGIENRKRFW